MLVTCDSSKQSRIEPPETLVIPDLIRNPGPRIPMISWILNQVQDDGDTLMRFFRGLHYESRLTIHELRLTIHEKNIANK